MEEKGRARRVPNGNNDVYITKSPFLLFPPAPPPASPVTLALSLPPARERSFFSAFPCLFTRGVPLDPHGGSIKI